MFPIRLHADDALIPQITKVYIPFAICAPTVSQYAALAALLEEAKLLRQKDTMMNGLIRLLEYCDSIIIQEYTDKKEVALRKAASIEAADRFIEDRLQVYEKMWDGCGCKIDYNK